MIMSMFKVTKIVSTKIVKFDIKQKIQLFLSTFNAYYLMASVLHIIKAQELF